MSRQIITLLLWLGAVGGSSAATPTNTLTFPAGMTSAPRARVVVVEHPRATAAFAPQLPVVREMVDYGLTNLTGRPTVAGAWASLVSTQETVGIKVFASPGPMVGTRPGVVEALLASMLASGWSPQHILIWDKYLVDLRRSGFVELGERFGVQVAGSQDAGYDTNHFYDALPLGQLVWGDRDFGEQTANLGRKSYVSKLVTQQMTKIILVTPLMNHNLLGVSGNLYSLSLGSVDNIQRFNQDPELLASAVPDLFALEILGDRVVLNVVDALIGQYLGEQQSMLHYSAVLNQLRFGKDPVALDVLSFQELERHRESANAPQLKPNLRLYRIATALEIGVSDPELIQIETGKLGSGLNIQQLPP
jgi:hypothetical protein